MKQLFLVLLFATVGCIPPAGFANRTPTPAVTRVSAADICADYIRDAARAVGDLQRDISMQATEMAAVAATGRPPSTDIARRIAERRDDIFRQTTRFEREAPCPEGEASRSLLARTAAAVRDATNLANGASDTDSPVEYARAAASYRRANDILTGRVNF